MYTILFIQPNQGLILVLVHLKIYLNKAYDKLEWPFTMNSSSFLTNFLLISLNSSWIVLQLLFCLFYGMEKIGSIFCLAFGLPQGDTLSPYIFMCLKTLNHSSLCYDQALYTKKLKPLTIKCHPNVFNYFWSVDDMFLLLTPNLSVDSFSLSFSTYCISPKILYLSFA